jgi:hypothetical protein
VSVEDDKHSGWLSDSKTIEMLKKFRTHLWRLLPNNPWTCRHRWHQLWSLLGDLNRKFEHSLHCRKVCSPTLDKWSKAAVLKHVSWATREG